MKKIVFVFIMFFALFITTDTVFAKNNSEYADALKNYNSGKFTDAVTILKEYIKKNPQPSAYYLLGYALYELGNYDEANEYFKETYFIDPTFSPARTGYAKVADGTIESQ